MGRAILSATISLSDKREKTIKEELEIHGDSIEDLFKNLLHISFLQSEPGGIPMKVKKINDLELKEVK